MAVANMLEQFDNLNLGDDLLQAKGKRNRCMSDTGQSTKNLPREDDEEERRIHVPTEHDDDQENPFFSSHLKRGRSRSVFQETSKDTNLSTRRDSEEIPKRCDPRESYDPSMLHSSLETRYYSTFLEKLAESHRPKRVVNSTVVNKSSDRSDSGIETDDGSSSSSPRISYGSPQLENSYNIINKISHPDNNLTAEGLISLLPPEGNSPTGSRRSSKLSSDEALASPDSQKLQIGTTTSISNKEKFDSGTAPINISNERIKAAHAASCVARLKREQLALTNELGDNLLHRAIKNKDEHLFSALLYRCDREGITQSILEVRNKENLSPLHLATVMNLPKFVELLVKRNANANCCFCLSCEISANDTHPPYYNALHYATGKGDMWLATTIELLKSSAVNFQIQDSEGNSPLHCAIAAHGLQIAGMVVNSSKTVEQLLLHGAPVLQLNVRKSMNALHLALDRNCFDLADVILRTVSNTYPLQPHTQELTNSTTGLGDTPLDLVANLSCTSEQRMNLMMTLLDFGAASSLLTDELSIEEFPL